MESSRGERAYQPLRNQLTVPKIIIKKRVTYQCFTYLPHTAAPHTFSRGGRIVEYLLLQLLLSLLLLLLPVLGIFVACQEVRKTTVCV